MNHQYDMLTFRFLSDTFEEVGEYDGYGVTDVPPPQPMWDAVYDPDTQTWSESAEGLAMKAEHEANLQAQAAAQAVSDAKALGFDYNGTMVPVTNADAIGALQIAYGFEQMGMAATNFHLSSGIVLPLTAAEWPTFKAAFFAARAAFFQ